MKEEIEAIKTEIINALEQRRYDVLGGDDEYVYLSVRGVKITLYRVTKNNAVLALYHADVSFPTTVEDRRLLSAIFEREIVRYKRAQLLDQRAEIERQLRKLEEQSND